MHFIAIQYLISQRNILFFIIWRIGCFYFFYGKLKLFKLFFTFYPSKYPFPVQTSEGVYFWLHIKCFYFICNKLWKFNYFCNFTRTITRFQSKQVKGSICNRTKKHLYFIIAKNIFNLFSKNTLTFCVPSPKQVKGYIFVSRKAVSS